MSRMSYKIHDVRNDVAHCCPLCSKPWSPPEGLTLYHGLVFWNEEEIQLPPTVYECLIYFLKKLGRPVSTEELFFHLYGDRADGGPFTQIINVNVSKVRKVLREKKIPLVIHCTSKGRFSSSYFIMTEVSLDDRHNTPQRPKIVHSR